MSKPESICRILELFEALDLPDKKIEIVHQRAASAISVGTNSRRL